VCPEWKIQQKILWAEVQKETGRWKIRWKIRDLPADGRCGQVVLDFLSSTDVRRLVPPLEEGDAGSQASEWERREHRGREEGRETEAEELGAVGELGAGYFLQGSRNGTYLQGNAGQLRLHVEQAADGGL